MSQYIYQAMLWVTVCLSRNDWTNAWRHAGSLICIISLQVSYTHAASIGWLSGVSGCPCSSKTNLSKDKAGFSISTWHFYAGMSSFNRWGCIASHLTFVWASKCKSWPFDSWGKVQKFHMDELTTRTDYMTSACVPLCKVLISLSLAVYK